MVHIGKSNCCSSVMDVIERIQENTGCSLVLTPCSMHHDGFHLWNISVAFGRASRCPDISIVICTFGRPESLGDTLASLTHQTFKQFEIVLITEKGHLSILRDKGLMCE